MQKRLLRFLNILRVVLRLSILFGLVFAAEVSEFLLLVVELEIVKELGRGSEIVEDPKHALANFGVNFLTVSALASRSVLVQRVFDVDELSVWNIFDLDPLNIDGSWPFSILFPHVLIHVLMIDCSHHLGQAAEMLGFVHAEKQINLSLEIWIFLFQLVYSSQS